MCSSVADAGQKTLATNESLTESYLTEMDKKQNTSQAGKFSIGGFNEQSKNPLCACNWEFPLNCKLRIFEAHKHSCTQLA